MHDVKGDQIGQVIRQGRPDKGMPAMPLSDAQILDVAAFLHARLTEAARSSGVPRVYPLEKLLTGNAEAGKTFFNGAGGCTKCHSVTGDLAGVAGKHSSIEFEPPVLYPGRKPRSAVMTLPSGEQVKGAVEHPDDCWVPGTDGTVEFRHVRPGPW